MAPSACHRLARAPIAALVLCYNAVVSLALRLRDVGEVIIHNVEVDTMLKQLTAIIEREGDGYVSLCPELDIASQGDTVEEARKNLQEALELFFETASRTEIQTRLQEEVYVTRMEVAVG